MLDFVVKEPIRNTLRVAILYEMVRRPMSHKKFSRLKEILGYHKWPTVIIVRKKFSL